MMYNGWKNYETWNVALWIGNDEGLYALAREVAAMDGGYKDFVERLRGFDVTETQDSVAWNDSGLDYDRLDEMMEEL